MKKFIYLILMLIPALTLVSCHDDGNDLPNVDFNLSFENGVEVDGTIYVVQGEVLKITAIDVVNNEADKSAMISSANYYWDGYYMGTSIQPPFGYELDISKDVPLGKHQIDIECPVFAVDKSPATAVVFMYVNIVESASDIPPMAEATTTVHPHISDTAAQ